MCAHSSPLGEPGTNPCGTSGTKSQKFLSPQPVLYGSGPTRPDQSAMPARPPNGPHPAPRPSKGRGILSRSCSPKRGDPHGSTRRGGPKAPAAIRTDYQACTIRTRSRCLTPRGAIEATTTTWTRGRLQTPTVYNFERQPLKPAHESLRGDTARRARESSGAAAVGPEDETR